jgi:hypothetical protein
VLWTLEGLRRELEAAPSTASRAPVAVIERELPHLDTYFPSDGEAEDDDDYLAMDRELAGRGLRYRG